MQGSHGEIGKRVDIHISSVIKLNFVTPLVRLGGRAQGCRKAALAFIWAHSLIRTNVYIDGFNLYYLALRGTPFRWLDFGKLASLLLPQHDIGRIRYFTAKVVNRSKDPNQAQRQQAYLRALQTVPNLSIHYGHFLTNTKRRPLVQKPANRPAHRRDTRHRGEGFRRQSRGATCCWTASKMTTKWL